MARTDKNMGDGSEKLLVTTGTDGSAAEFAHVGLQHGRQEHGAHMQESRMMQHGPNSSRWMWRNEEFTLSRRVTECENFHTVTYLISASTSILMVRVRITRRRILKRSKNAAAPFAAKASAIVETRSLPRSGLPMPNGSARPRSILTVILPVADALAMMILSWTPISM